jgi:hypothetical protein
LKSPFWLDILSGMGKMTDKRPARRFPTGGRV